MEFESQVAATPYNDGSQHHQDLSVLSSWSSEAGHEPPVIDQSHDVALVTRLLDRSFNCHAVCNEKILLWGLPGCG
jgi:hypothetical protein